LIVDCAISDQGLIVEDQSKRRERRIFPMEPERNTKAKTDSTLAFEIGFY